MQHGGSVHALLFIAALVLPLAAAQPWQICGSTGNYSANSTYQANLNQLGAALPKNASSSSALFASGAVGTFPEAAYALVLCRGDINASACAACIGTAFQDAQQLCPYDKEVSIVFDLCYLHFSNLNFLASTDNTGVVDLYNTGNVTGDVGRYDYEGAITDLLSATAEYAAGNSTRLFATGEMLGFDAPFPNIYSMAQCTPDLSPEQCLRCLDDLVGGWLQTFKPNTQGFRSVGARCNMRVEVYSFYTGPAMLQMPAEAAAPALAPPASALAPPALPGTTGERMRNKISTISVTIAVPTIVAVLAAIVAWFYARRRRKGPAAKTLQPYSTSPDDIRSIDSLLLDLSTLRVATDCFAEHKRLGEGGFGVVYKGDLPEGQEIAVKRLSQTSSQGMEELKTELLLVAKLNHKNLVRLVGVCLEEQEKILVYEYMPNRSLDTILFDDEKTKELDWGKRFKIINGTARALQYLHEDSQLKIVHRDLKASNVLLDFDYNPKISDFGLAKIFGGDQSQIVTHHIAGTYGYMSPEYAMRGQYSIKSDVFSFGVLVLEIVTGRRNCGTYDSEQDADLINATWEHWTREKAIELIDPSLSSHCPTDQLLKCIHIGLLCVQQKPADRPLMSAVNLMLSSNNVRLPSLSRPAFCTQEIGANSDVNSEQNLTASQWPGNSRKVSSSEVSITEAEPR